MIYAVNVKAMNNYLLLIQFNNGEERFFDCHPLFEDNIYAELKDKDFFNTVYINEDGLVCWNDSTDINPDYLYDNSELVSSMEFEAILNSENSNSGKETGYGFNKEYNNGKWDNISNLL